MYDRHYIFFAYILFMLTVLLYQLCRTHHAFNLQSQRLVNQECVIRTYFYISWSSTMAMLLKERDFTNVVHKP